METENHFAFFEFPEQFDIDEGVLRRVYLKLSKRHHPDFFVNDARAHNEAIAMTAVINKAYETLSKQEVRIAYLLRLKGKLDEKGGKLDPMFLMEMMDWNERIYESAPNQIKSLMDEYLAKDKALKEELWSACLLYDRESNEENLEQVKDFYLKSKYLLRIKEAIDKFADA